MSTPEGRVKDAIRKLLAKYDGMYFYMPVPSGYGRTTIDFLGCYRGRFFAIEAKAPGKKPTLKQSDALQAIAAAMGKTFVVDNVSSPVLEDLRAWLDQLTETVPNAPDIPPDPVSRRPI